ncbi:hypothetical protein [Trichodesmium erythraeum]
MIYIIILEKLKSKNYNLAIAQYFEFDNLLNFSIILTFWLVFMA